MIENQVAPDLQDPIPLDAGGLPPRRRFRRGKGEPPKPRSRRRMAVEIVLGLCLALLLALGIRAYAFQVFFVPSGSMLPTLQIGDRILVNKFLFNAHSVGPGTIIVFHTPPLAMSRCATDDGDLVKRVVAAGGDTIESKGNSIYVNGKYQKETYLAPGTALGQAIPLTTVPKNDVYVLGDNRSISCDSRVWGPVPDSSIVGKVVAVIWHGWHPDIRVF